MPDNASQPKPPRIVAGCMTGTSLDGLDVALVRIDGHGLEMKPTLIGHHAVSMPSDLRDTLMHLASGNAAEPIVYLRAARQLGLFHAEGLAELFAKHPESKPDFITAHGQTIWHAPRNDENQRLDSGPMSWQLFDPWPVVQRHGVPVCYDLRQADLIAGGEGAPLTPIADWVMYRNQKLVRMVVNLGGIANTTLIPTNGDVAAVVARDLSPCNLLVDGMVQLCFPEQRFDNGGTIASRGRFSGAIFAEVGLCPIREGSSGREEFSLAWVKSLRENAIRDLNDTEAVSAAVEAAAMWVVDAVFESEVDEIILAGGGCRNDALVSRLNSKLVDGQQLFLSDDLGIPCEAREAMGWAVLGALSQDGVAVSLPQVTGATDPGVAGVWAGVNRGFFR